MAYWEVSQTLGMERSESMDGRKRTVQIKFRVTEAERDLILEKMKLVPPPGTWRHILGRLPLTDTLSK